MNTTVLPNAEGRVLAAVDASLYGASVTDHAAWAAARLGASVDFLHVLDREEQPPALTDMSGSLVLGAQETLLKELTEADAQRSRLNRERGRVLLQAAAERARAAGAKVAETRLRHDHLLDALVELEPGVRLFVLGKRGEHADFAKGHLGGHLERVVRAVRHPLLVASRAFRPIARVMLAFDGSPTVLKGVEMLAASPLLRGLPIVLQVAGEASESLQRALSDAGARLQAAGFEVDAAITPGHPEAVLAEAVRAQAIDLLVMGAYGHSRIRQLFVGSTTTALLRACQIPVLLLR
ncbi:universal stress protein [Aquimonas voraii]|uniref:Nucleotide-binding universal stress protein, UspA family n=1 Tax=Aquimonas voraii TaxID=265719 RepID=A0A1G6WAD9_9GAMM|nr:universal stress protein [Aquimonas voraii]SDD62026.1 Nucleotide-binding universal stress protein, UspA family [Aquimonas voraii]